jgi:hypothetical protein
LTMAVCSGDDGLKTRLIATSPINESRRVGRWSGLESAVTGCEHFSGSESQVCDFCCLLVDNLRYFKFHWVKLKVDSFTVDRGVLECFRVWDVCLEETIPG